MANNKFLPISQFAVWGFIASFFAMILPLLGIASFLSCIIALSHISAEKRRGEGIAIAGIVISIFFLIPAVLMRETLSESDLINMLIMSVVMGLFALLLTKMIAKNQNKNTGSAVMAQTILPITKPGKKAPELSPAERQKKHEEEERNRYTAMKKMEKAQQESARKEAEKKAAETLDDQSVLEAENKRLEEEKKRQKTQEERNLERQRIAEAVRKAIENIPPDEEAAMTQQGQILFYDYAEKTLTGTDDCEAICREHGVSRADLDLNGPAFRLKHDKIASADLLIETVSGVMTELGERIIGTDEEFLRKIWTRLGNEDLLRGKKAFSFYKEISVGSEPFELMEELILMELTRRWSREASGEESNG